MKRKSTILILLVFLGLSSSIQAESKDEVTLTVKLISAECVDLCYYNFIDVSTGKEIKLEWNTKWDQQKKVDTYPNLDAESAKIMSLIENCAQYFYSNGVNSSYCKEVLGKTFTVKSLKKTREEEVATGPDTWEKTGKIEVYYKLKSIRSKNYSNIDPLRRNEFIDISGVYFGKDDKSIFSIYLFDNFWKVNYITNLSSDGSFSPHYPFELHPTEDPTRFVAKNISGYGEGELSYPTEFEILQHSDNVIVLSTPIYWIKTIKQDKLNINPVFPSNIEGRYTGKYGDGYIIEKVGRDFFYSEYDSPSIKYKLNRDVYADGDDIYFYSSTYKDLTVSGDNVIKYFMFFEREGQSYLVTKEDWDVATYVYQKESDSH